MSFYVNKLSGTAHFPHGPRLLLARPLNNCGRLKKELYCENVRREHWRESSISISR